MRPSPLLVLVVLAGCLSGPAPPSGPAPSLDIDAVERLIGTPIEVDHDHRDPNHADHSGGVNLELVSWNTLGVTLGENGFANFVFYEDDDEDLVFIAVDGDSRAGFVIADASNATEVRPLGSWFLDGNSVQEVRVTPDGEWAVLNVQAQPDPQDLQDADGGPDCTVCLHLLDVSDRSAPEWVDALPVDNIGTHNMDIYVQDGRTLVYYVGQPASYNFPTNLPGNYVGIAEITPTAGSAKLVPIGQWRDADLPQSDGRSFPHDVDVERHPLTGDDIAYVSYWDAGAVTVDVSDPTQPVTLDVDTTQDGSGALSIHWFSPEPAARADGRLIAWSAPEIGELSTDAGKIRSYDVSAPDDIQHLGFWGVPGNVTIPGAYVFSGHTVNVDPERGLVAVAHYHAGVWILDGTDPANPRHLAYYMPNGDGTSPYAGEIWWKKPNFNPEGFLPNAYQARWKDGLLWVSERGTGLYVLEYMGPVPGPLN